MSDTAAIVAILEANGIDAYEGAVTGWDSIRTRNDFVNRVTKFYREGDRVGRTGVFHPIPQFLDGNTLTVIPDDIGVLTKLEFLHLYDNRLDSLPNAIGKLRSLHYLKVYNNCLTTLPDSTVNLDSLRQLLLWGNQICYPLPPPITEWLEGASSRRLAVEGLDQQECSSTVLLMPRAPVSERPWSVTERRGLAFSLNGRRLLLVAAVSKTCGPLLIRQKRFA